MKKHLVCISLMLWLSVFSSCDTGKDTEDDTSIEEVSGQTDQNTSSGCGSYNGHTLYLGPQGGCYYINSNGKKTYVDRSECRC